jgi:hypothetical protein
MISHVCGSVVLMLPTLRATMLVTMTTPFGEAFVIHDAYMNETQVDLCSNVRCAALALKCR